LEKHPELKGELLNMMLRDINSVPEDIRKRYATMAVVM